jgi:transketolase
MVIESGYINSNFSNRNLKCGIREFAMGAISNGIALYGGLIPVQSTFMVFSDYLKSALRLTALMNQKVISVFTHDSIAVGEDGATHQSAEQLWSLRSTPRTRVYRPANLNETIACYKSALNYKGSSIMALSRQKLSEFACNINDASMGGYIVSKEEKGSLDGVIIATGSEVEIALETKKILTKNGYNIRVVSMPCVELFEGQSDSYKESVIPNALKSIFSIEAGSTAGWYKYVGKFGKCFGVDDFGMSASPKDIYNKFGLNAENISKNIIKVIKKNK